MPFRRTTRKPTRAPFRKARILRKRGRVVSRRSRYAPRMKLNSTKEIIPKFYTCKLTYFSEEVGSSSSTTPVVYRFAANGLYDPDLSGTGHQPRGFDQLKTLYNNYKVSAVKATLTAQLVSTTTYGYVGMAFNNHNVTTCGSLEEMKESARWTTKNLHHERPVTVSRYMKCAQAEGVTDIMYRSNQDLYAAGIGANPVVVPEVMVAWQHTDQTTIFQPYVQVKLVYYVQFYNRINIASS